MEIRSLPILIISLIPSGTIPDISGIIAPANPNTAAVIGANGPPTANPIEIPVSAPPIDAPNFLIGA